PRGRNQMRRRLHAARWLAEIPVAAGVVLPLEQIEGDALLEKVFRDRQARGSPADDAEFLCVHSKLLTNSCFAAPDARTAVKIIRVLEDGPSRITLHGARR